MRKNLLAAVFVFAMAGIAQAFGQAIRDADGAYRAGYGGIPTPRLLRKAPVVYPVEDLAGDDQGCILSAVIRRDGTAIGVTVIRSVSAGADEAAVQAVRDSKYGFGVYQGDPVPVRAEFWVPFLGHHWAGPLEMLPLTQITEDASVLSSPAADSPVPEQRPKAQGSVAVSVLVLTNGDPAMPFIVRSSSPLLDPKALDLIGRYRFKPAIRAGIPVPERITLEEHVAVN